MRTGTVDAVSTFFRDSMAGLLKTNSEIFYHIADAPLFENRLKLDQAWGRMAIRGRIEQGMSVAICPPHNHHEIFTRLSQARDAELSVACLNILSQGV